MATWAGAVNDSRPSAFVVHCLGGVNLPGGVLMDNRHVPLPQQTVKLPVWPGAHLIAFEGFSKLPIATMEPTSQP